MFHSFSYNKKTNRYSFHIDNLDLSIVNGIRRIISTNIPVVGFLGEENPTIEVIENNGPLHNEFIIHRIGLIPINFNDTEIDNFDSNDYDFELKVENNDSQMLNVTSNDIDVIHKGDKLTKKECEKLFPKNSLTGDYILITRLRPDEKLHINAKAVKLTVESHSGFSPVSLCTFQYKQTEEAKNIKNVLDKERTYHKNKYGDPTHFIFEIESECGLTPKYLVSKAIEILMNKLHKVIQDLDDIQTKRAKSGYEFHFKDEDDTLGNILQSLMHNSLVREKKLISYVGYYCPHPLDSLMVLKIIFEEDKEDLTAYKNLLIEQCRNILNHLQEVQIQWNSSSL